MVGLWWEVLSDCNLTQKSQKLAIYVRGTIKKTAVSLGVDAQSLPFQVGTVESFVDGLHVTHPKLLWT
jgi:hypothetical protein